MCIILDAEPRLFRLHVRITVSTMRTRPRRPAPSACLLALVAILALAAAPPLIAQGAPVVEVAGVNSRGTLSPGVPADVTLIDENLDWTYDVNRSPSKSRNSPFDGVRFRGGAVATIVGGAIVWQRNGG